MTITFSGTYTQNEGESAAVGTVTISLDNAAAQVATLDGTGHYSLAFAVAPVGALGEFAIVERLVGADENHFNKQAAVGDTVDTSRDIGSVAASPLDGHGITANRPSAVTVGKSSQFYDDTLNTPIWSDGTVWRNAAGTAV